MGKSAKTTRGGNKHRVNIGRQKAKLAAAGIKDHTAYDHAALAAAAAAKSKNGDAADASKPQAGRDAVKQQMAASLKAIQRQREQQRLNSTAVKMAPRPKKASGATAGKKE
jgi:hypothetical protein